MKNRFIIVIVFLLAVGIGVFFVMAQDDTAEANAAGEGFEAAEVEGRPPGQEPADATSGGEADAVEAKAQGAAARGDVKPSAGRARPGSIGSAADRQPMPGGVAAPKPKIAGPAPRPAGEPSIEYRPGEKGELSDASIDAAVSYVQPVVETCWNEVGGAAAGPLDIQFEIRTRGQSGFVRLPKDRPADGPTLGPLYNCMERRFQRSEFPVDEGGGGAVVTLPYQ